MSVWVKEVMIVCVPVSMHVCAQLDRLRICSFSPPGEKKGKEETLRQS